MSFNKDKRKRKKILNFIQKIQIRFSSLGFSDFTILIGLALILFTILIPWFTLPYNGSITQGIFSKINGIVGYVSILIVLLNLFILFSVQNKDKIKLFFNIKIKDKTIFIFSSILLLILGFNSLLTIKGLELLNSEIKYHSGITFYIIAGILFSIGVFFKLREKEKNTLISINESEKKENSSTLSESKDKKQNVMKLPFQ
ncbi:MAG: hypothetical protein Q9M94_02075 [Candidatus Gracilibacteria bacterium]|nr:hypothetical protein [Candidatus Gracilibacteria bacterium]MDQ7023340.1 hypothetical protein [Candidatus Gracilibacteria bacterium]